MTANFSAKDGPPVYPERLNTPPDRGATRSLATGVLELCSLCESLLTMAAIHDAAPDHLTSIAEHLEAVRAAAMPLAAAPASGPPRDPYSAAMLGQWVWRE